MNKVIVKLKSLPVRTYLIIFLVIFFILFAGLAIAKHYTLRTVLYDYGLEAQVIKNTANYEFFKSGVEVDNYLGDHFSPVPILISALIYKLLPSDITILSLQVILIILGLIGFYKLANLKLGNPKLSLVLTIVLALAPGVQGALLYDYHPIVYAFPFLIWAIYFNEKNNYRYSILLFLLACLVKEDVGIFVGLFGIVSLINKNRIGLVYAFIGFGITTLAIQFLIPAIRLAPSDTLMRYSYFGNSFSEIVSNILLKPLNTIEFLFTPGRLLYLFKLTFSTLFLPFIRLKEFIILFLPLFLINALSAEYMQFGASVHYDVPTTVAIFYILLLSLKYIFELKRFDKDILTKWLMIGMIVTLLLYLPFSKYFRELSFTNFSNYSSYLEITQVKTMLPKDKIMSVTHDIGGQFSDYSNLQLFNKNWLSYKVRPNYIVIYKTTVNVEPLEIFKSTWNSKKMIYESDKFIVFEL